MTRDPIMVIWPDGQTDRYRTRQAAMEALREWMAEGNDLRGVEVWELISDGSEIVEAP